MPKIFFVLATLLLLVGAGCQSQKAVNNSVEKTTEEQKTTLQLNGLSFSLPIGWEVESQNETIAKIKVPDPKYEVVIPFEIKEVSAETKNHLNLAAETPLQETASGAKIYSEFCAPTIYCSYIVFNGKTYLATFEEPESNEPMPENLDGVWFPSTTMTKEEAQQVIASIQTVEKARLLLFLPMILTKVV